MTTMIHIVLFNFDATRLAQEFPGDELQRCMENLQRTVPGVLELTINAKNAQPWPGYVDGAANYTHALVSKHTDAEALKVYANFPAHKEVQARMARCFISPPLRMELDVSASKL